MSVRGIREVYRCPVCNAEVVAGATKCPSSPSHTLAWGGGTTRAAALSAGTVPTTPTTGIETKIDWGVLILYILIVGILGIALAISLALGKDFLNFSTAIVTALTTIAGFAVGVNSGTPAHTSGK